jgi:hypothetical protein
LLQHTTDLTNTETYLTKLSQEIEEIAQHIRAYQSKEFTPNKPNFSNEQLLTLLGQKIAGHEIQKAYEPDNQKEINPIEKTWDKGFPYLGV